MTERLEIYKNGEKIYWVEVTRSKPIKDPVTLKLDISGTVIEDINSWAIEHDTSLYDVIRSLIYNKWKRIK